MIEFAKYERAESTLSSEGTVASLVGKDGTIGLIPKNIKDKSKRVVLVLTKKDGTSAQVTCSQQVSDGVRNKSITLGQVLNFEVLTGESGVPFISIPGALVTFAVKDIKVENFAPTSKITAEDLTALLEA